jgi:thiamine-phosphate pyrophosphorylase
MIDDLTPGTERAMAAAASWAQRLGAEGIAPVHMLLGLLDETEGAAAAVLKRSGLDIERWRAPYLSLPIPMEPATRPLSHLANRALMAARALAREHAAERSISTELLAVALAQVDPALGEELSALGLDAAELANRIRTSPERVAPDEPLEFADSVERADTARILDASANRAREALRVLEDFARFGGDDAGLTGQIKSMRHDLAEALEVLPGDHLLNSRETESDVGTEIHTDREMSRHSLRDVAQVNFKRLQESLRSLEEYGKLYDSFLGQRLGKLRYRSYTLERSMLLVMNAAERLAEARLYVLLSGETCQAALDWTIAEAAAGGAQIVQLREKRLSDRELIEKARDVRRWTHKAGVIFVMNDRPDIARLVGADGVHLGQDDMPVRDARRIVGPNALIGVSTHDLEQVRRAVNDGASYIGVGPTYSSTTKLFNDLAGLDFVRAAVAETRLPAFVLGGITLSNIDEVIQAGAKRVAVGAAIAGADDPRAVAAALRRALGE